MLSKTLITLPIYLHTCDEYESLRDKAKKELMEYWGFTRQWKKHYKNNKRQCDKNILNSIEVKCPTPQRFHDIAGFITIRMENPIEAYRVIFDVWSVENRKFKTKKYFYHKYSHRELIDKNLLKNEQKFNLEFLDKVEKGLNYIKRKFINKKKFDFNLNNDLFNWELTKSLNIAKYLIETKYFDNI